MSLQNCLKSEVNLGYILRSCLKVHRWVNKDLTIKVKTTCFLCPGSVMGTDKSNTVSALKIRLKGTKQTQKPEDCVRRPRSAGWACKADRTKCARPRPRPLLSLQDPQCSSSLSVTSSVSVCRLFSSLVWHCPIQSDLQSNQINR